MRTPWEKDNLVQDYLTDFLKTLTKEEKQFFIEFQQATKQSEEEAFKALVRFIEYPDTFERFKQNWEDISIINLEKLMDKIEEISDENIWKILETTQVQLHNALAEPAEITLEDF